MDTRLNFKRFKLNKNIATEREEKKGLLTTIFKNLCGPRGLAWR
jgi:hypothetical protein